MSEEKEKIKYESLRKYNRFKHLKDNTTILWTSNTNKEIYIDTEDFEKIKNYCWREDDYGYAKGNTPKSDNLKIRMHHIIVGKKEGLVVDHIDRNPLNNKKENLRFVKQRYNLINKSIQSNNTSGIIGVSYNKQRNFWDIRLYEYGKIIYRDREKDFEKAIIKRLKAELKYYGKDFAPQRHLFKEYDIE